LVTAEEVAKASTGGDVFALPTGGMMEAPESSLRDLLDREQARTKKGAGTGLEGDGGSEAGDGGTPIREGTGGGASRQASRFKSGHVGYDVSDKELAELAKGSRLRASIT
jgi:hypothetical protein